MNKQTEALKLAEDALKRVRTQDMELVQLSMIALAAIQKAQAEQPAQQEPVDFASLLREAEEIVREKPTWKRFIDGTPLANDIAVWMTVFAQDVARRTSPQPAQLSKPLTDEQIAEIAAQGHQRWIEFARAIEAAHGIKEKNT